MQKLLKVLEEKKISRLQLAMKAGISPSDLYSALSGKRFMFPGWRRKIAQYLQMDEAELFDRERHD